MFRVAKPVDPADKKSYAIRLAAGMGHVEVVRLLLLQKELVDPAADDNYAIWKF